MDSSQAPPNTMRPLKNWIGSKTPDSRNRPFAVILKSADRCNYSCHYCYVEEHCAVPVMPISTAKAAIERVLSYVGPHRKVNLIWHGGEPLLTGQRFYAQMLEICRQFPENVIEHCIQTNGALLTDEFVQFCASNRILISLSLDGPESITDAHRRTAAGDGTFCRTMRAFEMLRSHGMVLGCVCVLHQGNVNRIEELYDFFALHGINVRINPVVKSGRAADGYNLLSISPAEYGKAMCRLFDLWFDDKYRIQVDPLFTILGNLVSPTVWGCDYQGRCLESIIAINPDGSVFPCGRFAGMSDFRLGNIVEDSDLTALFSREPFLKLNSRGPETVEGCADCEFVQICNAGCMVTAYMSRHNCGDRDYYCEGRQMLFRHMTTRLKHHLESIKEESEYDTGTETDQRTWSQSA